MAVSHKKVSRKYGLTPSEREMKNSMWMVRYLHRVFLFHFLRFFSVRRMRSRPHRGAFPGKWRLPPTSVFADLPEELNL